MFNKYSYYYNFFYNEKNYAQEIKFINNNFFKLKNKLILEIGCGTGNHTFNIYNFGCKINALDKSSTMVNIAKSRLDINTKKKIKFINKDVLKLNVLHKHDAVLSLFDVFSYQYDYEKVNQFLKAVKKNIKNGGYFVFDFWHAPNFISNPPKNKKISKKFNESKIIRFTQPKLNLIDSTVDIKFKFRIINTNKKIIEFKENHRMKYFFIDEVKLFLENNGFKNIKFYNSFSKKRINIKTGKVVCFAQTK